MGNGLGAAFCVFELVDSVVDHNLMNLSEDCTFGFREWSWNPKANKSVRSHTE